MHHSARRFGRLIDDQFIRTTLSQFEELTRRTSRRAFRTEFPFERPPSPPEGSSVPVRTEDDLMETESNDIFYERNEPIITEVEEENGDDEEFKEALRQSLAAEEERKRNEMQLKEEEEALLKHYEQQSLRQKEMEDWEKVELAKALEFSKREQERLERERQDREERELFRLAQDRAFAESLKQDQERERIANEVKRKEQQRREQELDWEEEAKTKELSLMLCKQKKCQDLKKKLPEEPAANQPDVTRIAVRLPSGRRLERRFTSNTKLQVLKDWLDSQSLEQKEEDIPDNYKILTSFPSRSIDNLNQTFQDYGLVPRALVNIET